MIRRKPTTEFLELPNITKSAKDEDTTGGSPEINLTLTVYPRKFRIITEEKRGELIEILDAMIDRLVKVINARKTKTRVRLRAMTVLNDLIKTSYSMIRDAEIEQPELEIEELESQAREPSREEESEKTPSSEG